MEPEGGIERSLVVGTRIGRYETRRLLGRGGFGVVFAAQDVELDREVALKVLLPEHTYNTQLMQRFFQEARAAAKIEHPAIVIIHDFGRIAGTSSPFDGSAYIAMEMVRGESLASRLQRVGRISASDAVSFARQVASALAAAHRAGIIHRDLKPDNLMLAKDPVAPLGERIKVLDFGIAKLAEANLQQHSQQLRTGHVTFGTPLYMSPEQYRSAGTVDCRTDVYALGCILFEMVSGKPPFDGDFLQLFTLHTAGDRPLLRSCAAHAPAWLETLVDSMISADPEARPATMEQVEQALTSEGQAVSGPALEAVASAPTQHARVASVPLSTTLGSAAGGSLVPAERSRWKWSAFVVGVAAIAAMVAITLAVRRGGDAKSEKPEAAVVSRPPPPAVDAPSAEHVQAEAARSQARAFLDQKLFDDAVAEYQKAYELEPTPQVLFEIGEAFRLQGTPAPAISAYQRYLTAAPNGTDAAVAREQIAKLTRVAADQAAAPAVAVKVDAPPASIKQPAKTAQKQPATTKSPRPPAGSGAGSGSAPSKKVCPTNDPVCAFGGP